MTSLDGRCIDDLTDRQMKVGVRMIGHEVLLGAGDATSRVLPIEVEEGRYKIQFSSPFGFDPADLVQTITGVVEKTDLAKEYLVEVEACDTNAVVYSYKIGATSTMDLIPCRGRVLPEACYIIYMTFLSNSIMEQSMLAQSSRVAVRPIANSSTLKLYGLLIFSLLIGGGFFLYRRKKKSSAPFDPDLLTIGDYRFNKRNMTLSYNDESIELTSKEADLLFLLYKSSNKTLERENILNVVWGDDGDYTGRTLDVFISKLRKKLVADNSLKIINIRGVGYRFVVNQ